MKVIQTFFLGEVKLFFYLLFAVQIFFREGTKKLKGVAIITIFLFL